MRTSRLLQLKRVNNHSKNNIILFSLKDVLYMANQYQSIFNALEVTL